MNETSTRLRALEREPDPGSALGDQAPGETKGDGRVSLCIKLYRVRILDKDNAYAATKILTDCLCDVDLIPGDSEKEINLKVTQEKVLHFNEQRTEVIII